MTYADDFNLRTYNVVKMNDVANAVDGLITRCGVVVTGGTSTAYTATISPAWTALTAGSIIGINVHTTSGAAATLNVNSLGATTIKDSRTGLALVGSEMLSGSTFVLQYYNSVFWLLNGLPGMATWTPTITGFSSNPTNSVYRYHLIGKKCTAYVRQATAGTSNSTAFTISAPFTAATITNMIWFTRAIATTDNGVIGNNGLASIASGGTSFTITKDDSSTAFTNSGSKGTNFTLTYEIA